MGAFIDSNEFAERDYLRFRERLETSLSVLGELLEQPGFGTGPTTVGAETELFVIDGAARPLPGNTSICAAVGDQRIIPELNRYSLELNSSPTLLAGRPFSVLERELNMLLDRVAGVASDRGGRLVLIGILPTLQRADLAPGMMTDLPRYRALGDGLRRLRLSPFRVRISGADQLDVTSEDIALAGANTSFQVHLRVAPGDFTATYNAVQLATAPALAVSGNSPMFLGHRLWEETRIALYKQATDDRQAHQPHRHAGRTALGTGWLRGGALELFTQGVRQHRPLLPVLAGQDPAVGHPPSLAELRLHQGTLWPWNRAIYDPAYGGHLRIEMRALSAGPTVTDMMANAAFLIGLSLWLARQDQRWTYRMPFERVDHNFYRAAEHGLAARLTWPGWHSGEPRVLPAAELVTELVPLARQGLLLAGVAADEVGRLLDVISRRAARGQTGAAWQRAALAAERDRDQPRAFTVMLERYLHHAASGQPVHTWPAP